MYENQNLCDHFDVQNIIYHVKSYLLIKHNINIKQASQA